MANLYTEWMVQLVNGRTGLPINDDTGIINILKDGEAAVQTIYATSATTTAVTQTGVTPAIFSNGRYRWYTASDVTVADICYLTAAGEAGFAVGMTPSDHRLVVWPENSHHTMVIPITAASGVTETGFRIWDNMLVDDVFVRTRVTGTAALMDIGTSTDANGFLDAAVVTATGTFYVTGDDASGTARIFGDLLTTTTSAYGRRRYHQANSTSGSTIVTDNKASGTTVWEAFLIINYSKFPVA